MGGTSPLEIGRGSRGAQKGRPWRIIDFWGGAHMPLGVPILGYPFGGPIWGTRNGYPKWVPIWGAHLGCPCGVPMWGAHLGDPFGGPIRGTHLGDPFGGSIFPPSYVKRLCGPPARDGGGLNPAPLIDSGGEEIHHILRGEFIIFWGGQCGAGPRTPPNHQNAKIALWGTGLHFQPCGTPLW